MTAKELSNQMLKFSSSYFLSDLRKDKNHYYALTEEDLSEHPLCLCGRVLNLMMDGNLQEAENIIESLPDDSIFKAGLSIVNPRIDYKGFIRKVTFLLKEKNTTVGNTTLTAGRPYLMNGFNDFSRLGPLLVKKAGTLQGIHPVSVRFRMHGPDLQPFPCGILLSDKQTY